MPEIPYRLSQAKEYVLKTIRPQEYQRRQTFKALRETAIAQSQADLRIRLATRPNKTPFEQSMGIFNEELEPQVREAVISLRELGYSTTESGFWDKDYHQFIEMDNMLTTATKDALHHMGVSVREENITPFFKSETYITTSIEFQSDIPDLEAIRHKWNAIVAVFPPSGEPLLSAPRWSLLLDEAIEKGFFKNNPLLFSYMLMFIGD